MTVRVRLWGSLRALTDGEEVVEVDAGNLKEVLDAIRAAYPALGPQIGRGVSFAIDGAIFRDAWFMPVRPDQEIVMMPYMTGG